MIRTALDLQGRARYRVRRPDWAAIGYALWMRVCLVLGGAALGTILLTQGWIS